MAGLFAALLLQRAGWSVDVFERANVELSGRGAGIVTHAEMEAVLERAGIDPRKDLGVAVQAAKRSTIPGKTLLRMTARRSSPPGTACLGCCAAPFPANATIWTRNCSASKRAPIPWWHILQTAREPKANS